MAIGPLSATCEQPIKNTALVVGLHMHLNGIVIFAKKKNMSRSNESHMAIEFKYAAQAPGQQTTEGIELFERTDNQLIVFVNEIVMFQQFYEIWYSQVVYVFRRTFEFFVYLLYYLLRNHKF